MGFQQSFKALSDPVRREILSLLRRGPMAAGDIAAHFELSGATVSHHLAILRDAGLEPLTNTEEAVQRAVDIAAGRA